MFSIVFSNLGSNYKAISVVINALIIQNLLRLKIIFHEPFQTFTAYFMTFEANLLKVQGSLLSNLTTLKLFLSN